MQNNPEICALSNNINGHIVFDTLRRRENLDEEDYDSENPNFYLMIIRVNKWEIGIESVKPGISRALEGLL